ncbi:MAG: hypothetical protein J6M62_05350 [Selenomonadaceae bacterium]|nr:hypothetical protein [Selenomonadaceae bacterium]
MAIAQNSSSDVLARTPQQCAHGERCVLPRCMRNEQSRLDDTLQDTDTEDEFIKLSRREGRRKRRAARRLEKRQKRSDALGGMENVFAYSKLYKAGKKCCNGVRWKQSVQRFELRLFSGTAVRRRALINGSYRFSKYVHFTLRERGKIRPIDAPRIQDRQVEKVYTQLVLLPLYLPSMIYNNGASLPGKGFHFSQKMLANDLRKHFRKFKLKGGIALADGKKFFPSADHNHIRERHKHFIFNQGLKKFADAVLKTIQSDEGMPLGVEPSQAEMIAYPSGMDNYLKAQERLQGGHYMDDFYNIVPPDRPHRKILSTIQEQATKSSFTLNPDKTRYVPFTKPFRFCKTKFIITGSGRIIRRANKKAVPRDRKKIKALYRKVMNGEITFEDVWTSVNGMLAYLECYNEHNNILKLRRLFYSIFGFSCENYLEFKRRDRNAVRHD